MKIPPAFVAILTLALAGCASGPMQPPRTGRVSVIDGVEVWKDGVPSRPYRVFATIRKQAADQGISSRDQLADVVRIARKRGADAVVVLDQVMAVSRMDATMSARPVMAPKIEAQLVRYQ